MGYFDAMMKWEAGELSDEETVTLFQALIDDGTVWDLQGMYGRMAESLINAGLCYE